MVFPVFGAILEYEALIIRLFLCWWKKHEENELQYTYHKYALTMRINPGVFVFYRFMTLSPWSADNHGRILFLKLTCAFKKVSFISAQIIYNKYNIKFVDLW